MAEVLDQNSTASSPALDEGTHPSPTEQTRFAARAYLAKTSFADLVLGRDASPQEFIDRANEGPFHVIDALEQSDNHDWKRAVLLVEFIQRALSDGASSRPLADPDAVPGMNNGL